MPEEGPSKSAFSFARLGRAITGRVSAGKPVTPACMPEVAHSPEAALEALLSSRSAASSARLAAHILHRWRHLNNDNRLVFMTLLARRFGHDAGRLEGAIARYQAEKGAEALRLLFHASRPPRHELIRRLSMAPGGAMGLIEMREWLLSSLQHHPELQDVETDLADFLSSSLNHDFLTLRSIDWTTPASVLEKMIRYGAVAHTRTWDELKHQFERADRRFLALFHTWPSDDPLFVAEIALTSDVPVHVDDILAPARRVISADEATTAVLCSISGCQPGLEGISLGDFLMKRVFEHLRGELPRLETFATLSPMPGFARWLTEEADDEQVRLLGIGKTELQAYLANPDWMDMLEAYSVIRPVLMRAAAHYLLTAKGREGHPADAVARFHLGNGARLERINFLADRSPAALTASYGMMVNYVYELERIEANHEAFVSSGRVSAAGAVKRLLSRGRQAYAFTAQKLSNGLID